MQPSDIAAADEEWLIDLCHKAENEGGMIGGEKYGDKVIKISDNIAVKYGGVQSSEATTQEFAFNHVDRNIVHVPQVYRFIESKKSANPHGYLFMEYVEGQNLSNLDLEIHQDIPSRVTKILAHLGQVIGPAPIPGPIGGGEPQGYLFGDDGANTIFSSVEDLNVYMNKRLQYRNDSIDLKPYPLVLCHGDICRRNLILEKDGSLCLVDWGYAGLYPRFFELATISCVLPYDAAFEKPVICEFEKLLGLTEHEKQDMKLALCVRGANLRWSFNETQPIEAEKSSDEFFQELLARSEKHRKEREAAGIPEFGVSSLHSGNIVSEVESHTAKPCDLSGEDMKG